MPDFQSGKINKATWDGTDVCVTGFSYAENPDINDTTNSCSAGVKTSIIGAIKYEGSFDLFWDEDARPTETPNVTTGQTGTLKLFIDGTDFFQISALITGFEVTSDVNGMVTVSCSWEGQGAPTYPA
jgi:hypothetical protein